MFLEEALDEGREETEDEKEVSRGTPAKDVALMCEFIGREPGGGPAGLVVSPARSINVLRGGPLAGGGMEDKRALVAEADISLSLPGEGILLGGRIWEMNCISYCQSGSCQCLALSIPDSRCEDPSWFLSVAKATKFAHELSSSH